MNNKEIDIDTDVVKAQLHTSTYAPNQDTHKYRSDLTNELSTASGYTAAGVTLGSPVSAYTAGTNVWNFDANDAVWTITTPLITFRYCVVYDSSPATDATRPLLMYVDTGGDQTIQSTTLTFQWSASGLMQTTVS